MNQKQLLYIFLIPPFIFLFTLGMYPLIEAVYLSLCDLDFRFPGTGNFVGLKNYIDLFNDSRFYNDIAITLSWFIITTVGSLLVGIALASIVNEYTSGKVKSLCLFAFVIPVLLPSVAGAFMWKLMFTPAIGIIPFLLSFVGFKTPILGDPHLALFACSLVYIWQWGSLIAALVTILFESVPRDPIEAARVFGASGFTLYRSILIPIIKPGLISLTFYIMVMSLRSFDYIYVMTAGGPGISTETLDLYAYWQAIGAAGRVSYASTISIIMLLFTIVIMSLYWKMVWVKSS
jgi:multiple sugar transport system permease protein